MKKLREQIRTLTNLNRRGGFATKSEKKLLKNKNK